MAEPVTTHQLSMGIILVVMCTITRITMLISNGANNYFRHQISSVQPTPIAKTSHMIILVHYFGALDTMKVVRIGVLCSMATGHLGLAELVIHTKLYP